MPFEKRGFFFALSAAALNGTIGVFSKVLMQLSINPAWIAFLKTVIGFIIISMVLFLIKPMTKNENRSAIIMVSAFFGIFTLFYFETNAYEGMSAANVVLILMSVSAITANISGWIILNDKPTKNQWAGFFLTVIGISAILGITKEISMQGALFAICAGIGYGLFTVILKKFKIKGGLLLTRQLLFWGAIFLSIPAIQQPINFNVFLSYSVVLSLLGLAILPSTLGFFCTTKAIDYLQPAKVQLLELSEPLFSAAIAFVVLGEIVRINTIIGAGFVIIGIYIGAIRK